MFSSRISRITLMLLAVAAIGCEKGSIKMKSPNATWHQKFNWVAEEYFDDPQVIALCQAIEANDLEEMDRLITAGADVNARGKGNMTPLLWALPDNHLPRFKKLLEQGADPNVVVTSDFNTKNSGIRSGDSVTHMACKTHFPKYFEQVFQHGGDPNMWNPGEKETPLYVLIKKGGGTKKEKIQLLIDKGADLNRASALAPTPALQATSWGGQYGIALMLLKAGTDPQSYQTDKLVKLIHVVVGEERRLPYMTPQQKSDYKALVTWLESHGESLAEARVDIQRWNSWGGDPKHVKEMREKEILEREAQEKAAAQKKKPAPQKAVDEVIPVEK